MGFLAPYLLWGTLAAAIPVILHLFFRSRYRTVPWAAMKFLLTSVEQTSRRLRFQELLLLMLRILVLAVIALALARPIFTSFREAALLGLFIFVQAFALARLVTSDRPSLLGRAAEFGLCEVLGLVLLGALWLFAPAQRALGGRGDAVDAAFVFDTSMSMGAQDGGKTRLERARAEAVKVLEQLPPHSTVQIITCAGGGADVIGPRSPSNFDQARGLLGELQPVELSTDLSAGVAQAARVLQHGQSPNKELYVFSDMQKLGWEKNASALAQAFEEAKARASVVLVRCGTRPVKNVAVVGIVPQSGAPRPGARAGFAVLVRNTGTEPVENLRVLLAVDADEKAIQRALDTPDAGAEKLGKGVEAQALARLGPGETKAVPLTARFDKAGLHVLTALAGPDDLPGDNRLDQVVQVRDFVHVLIVDDNYDERDEPASSSYFLKQALAPVEKGARLTYHLQPKVVPTRLASPALLAKADLCFLVNVPVRDRPTAKGDALPADFADELGRFVRQGHGLAIFAGDNVRADAYNQVLGQKQGLLPLPIRGKSKAAGGSPLYVDRDSFALPAFAKFKDDDYYKDFSKVEVWQALDVDDSPGQDKAEAAGGKKAEEDPVTVALRTTDGKPLVVTRKVDAGEVVLVTTAARMDLDPKTLNPTWTDWPLHLSVYLPFTQVLVSHLLHGQTEAYNVTAGEALHWHPTEKAPRAYTLVHPDGKAVRLGAPEKKGMRSEVFADGLPRAGVYHLLALQPHGPDDTPGADTAAARDAGVPIAAAPDLRETADLSSYSDAEIDTRLGFAPLHLVADSGAEVVSVADRLNREWTLWLLTGVLGLLVCEMLLAWWCGRAW
jgi:hypothetical protein